MALSSSSDDDVDDTSLERGVTGLRSDSDGKSRTLGDRISGGPALTKALMWLFRGDNKVLIMRLVFFVLW